MTIISLVPQKVRIYHFKTIVSMDYIQTKVTDWMKDTFTPEVCMDNIERNLRFIEESLELVQSNGCTKEDVIMLLDYVFGRPKGEVHKEIVDVNIALNALASASMLDVFEETIIGLSRVWINQDRIRQKHLSKPENSPLP